MKNAIQFDLSGTTAAFSQPSSNNWARYTYSHIHKPALLGLLGAILGYKGYNQEQCSRLFNPKQDVKLEFHDKLKDLQVAIVPQTKSGLFNTEMHTFSNTTCHANASANLLYTQQWLKDVAWTIVILDNGSTEYQSLKEALLNANAVFTPYLGTNEHLASLTNVKEVVVQQEDNEEEYEFGSLFPYAIVEDIQERPSNCCFFLENLPVGRNENYQYIEEMMHLTHDYVIVKPEVSGLYQHPTLKTLYFH